MRGLILAVINPDNTPHGYDWTFAFPMLLFIVVAVVCTCCSAGRTGVPATVSAAAGTRLPRPSGQAASVAGGLAWRAAA